MHNTRCFKSGRKLRPTGHLEAKKTLYEQNKNTMYVVLLQLPEIISMRVIPSWVNLAQKRAGTVKTHSRLIVLATLSSYCIPNSIHTTQTQI